MNSSRFLIVGAYGQLGKALQAQYPNAVAVDRDSFDMTNAQTVEAYDWSKIDVILNAAAYTNVDGAETSEGRLAAWKINATGPGYLARIANLHDITLVHVSSEYVFNGSLTPHTEDEPYTPLGVYAQTKAAGDIAVAVATKHYICRTSWLIGDGPNFVRTMIGLAAKNISPKVVGDQIGRLTFTATLVGVIDHLLSSRSDYGTYNVSNVGKPASWADITQLIYQQLSRDDLSVTNIASTEYFADKPDAAPRPLHSEFELSKIVATGALLTDFRAELSSYVTHEISQAGSNPSYPQSNPSPQSNRPKEQ